jgi:ergot alkaloid biosynthesis protein
MTDTILVTGGTGKVGRRVARRLRENGYDVYTASRKQGVESGNENVAHRSFDWADETTYRAVLAGVQRLFLVAPVRVADPSEQMNMFLTYALQAGVQRVVLLSSSLVQEGMMGPGMVHKAIREQAPEWAVLRPSWFMQNFVEDHYHATSIRDEGVIVAATGDGCVGFVDADDIAEVALHVLIDAQPHNRDYIITGPQALSYAQVAQILSQTFGRSINFVCLPPEQMQARLVAAGMPPAFAELMAQVEYQAIRNGLEDRVTSTVEQVTGRLPHSLAEFASNWVATHPH